MSTINRSNSGVLLVSVFIRVHLWLLAFPVLICGSSLRAERLTIATYNVQNYGLANRMTEAGYRTEYPKPEKEKAALRRVIRALNADVLVLQEMGPQPYLDELRRDLQAEGSGYPHAMLAEAADKERHVALLSRRPLTVRQTVADLGFTYLGANERVKRGLLCAAVQTSRGELAIFGVHLKSRYTDRADDPESAVRRNGEATAVRDEILRRHPDPTAARFVVVGDFNDTKASKPLERFLHRGKTTIAVLLPAADSHGERWTYLYGREDAYSRVDHILISPALRTAVGENSCRIYDGDGVREASDHRPVIVELEL